MWKSLEILWKGLKSFGLFWKNFLIGDAPEIALGVIFILAIAFLLRKSVLTAEIVIPVAVILLLFGAIWRKTRS